MNPIGGYFELEVNDLGSIYHDAALTFNSGRNAFEHIILCKKYRHLYIPFFTCDVILEPLVKHGVSYTFYNIDHQLKPVIPTIEKGSAILYTNYFGLMFNNIIELKLKTNDLIVDNSQAFYDNPIEGLSTFYSPRKFFGLPDGGLVYNAHEINPEHYELDLSLNRISHLITRIEQDPKEGYNQFKENDAALNHQPIRRMSKLTYKLMRGIDYEKVKSTRIENFNYLHQHLNNKNELSNLIDNAEITCPMVYPYLSSKNSKLRQILNDNEIYTAQYWPNVLEWTNEDSFENKLTKNIINLPIDQRYTLNDISFILDLFQNV